MQHIDPILLTQPHADTSSGSLSNASLNRSIKGGLRSRTAINEVMPSLLEGISADYVNELGWASINGIEDSVLRGENMPFPLGMKVSATHHCV